MRILVIDDTQANLTVMSAALETFGFAPTCTADPLRGFQLAQSENFSLVIVDLRMPVIDGLSFVQMLRSFEGKSGRAAVPLLALTADLRRGVKKTLLAAGVNAFMEKPFDMAVLRETVQALIHGTPISAPL